MTEKRSVRLLFPGQESKFFMCVNMSVVKDLTGIMVVVIW